MLSYIKDNNNFFTVVTKGRSYQFDKTHINYDKLVQAIKEQDSDDFLQLISVVDSINTWGSGKFQVVDGVLKYGNAEVQKVLADKILQMIEEDFDYMPMLNFVENLLQNPSFRAVNELYTFLENKYLPITPDGCFLAYKAVRNDFKDKYKGVFDNSVGNVVSVPRNTVDEDYRKSCSHGLHAGAIEYVRDSFASDGDKIIIVKINPRDVVSVPLDYNCQKLRCCEYEVVGLFEGEMKSAVEEKYEPCSCDDDDDDDEECDCDYCTSYCEECDEHNDECDC